MRNHFLTLVLLALLVLPVDFTHARGPDYSSKSGKNLSGGSYSKKGVPATSGYARPAVSKSKYQVQRSPLPGYSTKYNRGSVQTPATPQVNKYSTKRPSYPVSPQRQPSVTPPKSASSPTTNVRFPTRPTYRPATTASPATSGKPAFSYQKPSGYQKPPVVFFPQASRQPATTVRNPPVVNTTPSNPPVRKKAGYQPLRPDYSQYPGYGNVQQPASPTIINRPTNIINNTTNITNQTTNITNNQTNINNWFQQNAWQNRVTINSNHWNGQPWWYKPDYGDWHHGHWHGQNYFKGRNAWTHTDANEHPWLNGLVSWGLGNLVYRTGYQGYANPYWTERHVLGTTTIDYSLPICVQQSAYAQLYANDPNSASRLRLQALSWFAKARQTFYQGDPKSAFDQINNAIALTPDDTSLHEFRSLTLFAVGRYRSAAESIHAVLAVAPGWDWTTLSGLYQNNATYMAQLRALEQFTRQHSREPHLRFLLAYHYITLGYPENAMAQLRATLILQPSDRLSADLLSLLDNPGQPNLGQTNPGLTPATGISATGQYLQGDWKARRLDGEIELEIRGSNFRWDFDLRSNGQRFQGRYSLTGNTLVLATDTGSQMVGTLTVIDRNRFVFRLLGSSPHDSGLEFVRR